MYRDRRQKEKRRTTTVRQRENRSGTIDGKSSQSIEVERSKEIGWRVCDEIGVYSL